MILEMLVTETIAIVNSNAEEQPDLSDHPLIRDGALQDVTTHEVVERRGQRSLEPYEAHILNDIGVSGAVRRQRESSQDQSGYNSKDSDFSNNDEGSQVADDFGGNLSQNNSNSNYDDDEF